MTVLIVTTSWLSLESTPWNIIYAWNCRLAKSQWLWRPWNLSGWFTINTLLHRHTVKCLLSIFIPADSLLLFPVFHQRSLFYLGKCLTFLLCWEVLCRLLGRKVSKGLTPAPATSSCSVSPNQLYLSGSLLHRHLFPGGELNFLATTVDSDLSK